jgi:hypothetical protein
MGYIKEKATTPMKNFKKKKGLDSQLGKEGW